MSNFIYLQGSEQVQQAASSMRESAERMERAMSGATFELAQLVQRIEESNAALVAAIESMKAGGAK